MRTSQAAAGAVGQIARGCEQEKLREKRRVSKLFGVMWSWSETTARKVSRYSI